MKRASLTDASCPTRPARASLSPKERVALLEPAPKQQVHHPNYRQDACHREPRDHPKEHSNYALPSITRLRMQRSPYPPEGHP
jgi:hypothetical protein